MQVIPTFSSARRSPQVLGVSRQPDYEERSLHPVAVEHVDQAGREGVSLLPNSTYGRGPSSKVSAISLSVANA